MKYDWEYEALDLLDADEEFPSHLRIIGVAVENTDTGEAALVSGDGPPTGCVIEADVWQDVLADVEAKYQSSREAAFSGFTPKEVH